MGIAERRSSIILDVVLEKHASRCIFFDRSFQFSVSASPLQMKVTGKNYIGMDCTISLCDARFAMRAEECACIADPKFCKAFAVHMLRCTLFAEDPYSNLQPTDSIPVMQGRGGFARPCMRDVVKWSPRI